MLKIVDAAKEFSISRAKIYRAIERGDITPKLDENGVKLIDPADMVRVFGSKANTNKIKKEPVQEQVHGQMIELLTEQLKQAQERERFYKEEIANIRKDFDDYKLMITMKSPLPHQEQPEMSEQVNPDKMDKTPEQQVIECNDRGVAQEDAPQKKGFFSRFFR